MIDSRSKGKVGERELCAIFDRANLEYVREQDGRTQGADFRLASVYCVEARRRNQLRMVTWSRELEAQTPNHLVPVLAYRPDFQPWRCSLLLSDFVDMAKAVSA